MIPRVDCHVRISEWLIANWKLKICHLLSIGSEVRNFGKFYVDLTGGEAGAVQQCVHARSH